jgi:hypothetical protein
VLAVPVHVAGDGDQVAHVLAEALPQEWQIASAISGISSRPSMARGLLAVPAELVDDPLGVDGVPDDDRVG